MQRDVVEERCGGLQNPEERTQQQKSTDISKTLFRCWISQPWLTLTSFTETVIGQLFESEPVLWQWLL